MLTVHAQHAAMLQMLLVPDTKTFDCLSVWQKLWVTRLASNVCVALLFHAICVLELHQEMAQTHLVTAMKALNDCLVSASCQGLQTLTCSQSYTPAFC